MARPRKYETEADAKAAKLEKQRASRAAVNALKKDPTKRKDAAVNAQAHPFAPINDETMSVIRQIMSEARKEPSNPISYSPHGRAVAAMLLEWEDVNSARLPILEEETVVCGHTANGVPITYKTGEGYEWNQLCSRLRGIAFFMERNGRNKLKADRNAVKEQTEADDAGLTVADLRTNKDVTARRKWEDQTQAAFHRAKADEALAKRNARIEQESTECMKESEAFGRF
ncbi:hypothetical protein [Neorhizobium alkalisoli]|uniref:hypothetical protein n=1 Tax=Neorhizobium alkalisoli TaxID=528178 RepID=UPI000CF8C6F4|nr:hypothetical protein [Neorhizobium alkalisoli]